MRRSSVARDGGRPLPSFALGLGALVSVPNPSSAVARRASARRAGSAMSGWSAGPPMRTASGDTWPGDASAGICRAAGPPGVTKAARP